MIYGRMVGMSDTEKMTITEFLEARIAEDEREALVCLAMPEYSTRRWRRVLAECAAKRAIIAAQKNQEENDDDMAWIVASEVLLRAIAAVYADHADYQQEWAK